MTLTRVYTLLGNCLVHFSHTQSSCVVLHFTACTVLCYLLYHFSQEVINYLRGASHSTTYAASMPAPVAQQIISSMRIISGEDGTKEGGCGWVISGLYTNHVWCGILLAKLQV